MDGGIDSRLVSAGAIICFGRSGFHQHWNGGWRSRLGESHGRGQQQQNQPADFGFHSIGNLFHIFRLPYLTWIPGGQISSHLEFEGGFMKPVIARAHETFDGGILFFDREHAGVLDL